MRRHMCLLLSMIVLLAGPLMLSGCRWPWASLPGLYQVVMLSHDDGWAVGGGIFHYSHGTWTQVANTSDVLFGLAFASPTEGWAVGGQGKGLVLHYTNGKWTQVASPTDDNLMCVGMVSASDGWAVGGGGIFHYDGSTWTVALPADSVILQGIGGVGTMATLPDGTAWAVSSYALLQWDGHMWNDVPSPLSQASLNGIAIVSPSEVWAVGDQGTILHGMRANSSPDSMELVQVPSPTSKALSSVTFTSASNGWAVGQDGVIVHYDGTRWTTVPSPHFTGSLQSVSMVSAAEGWAVGSTSTGFGGSGVIMHYANGAWSQYSG